MQVPLMPTNYYFGQALTALTSGVGSTSIGLAAGKMMLGQDAISPGLTINFAALNECTFGGYSQSTTIVWGSAINDVDTTPTSISPSHLFRATSGTTPNQVQNVAITDGVAAPNCGILASGSVSPPISIAVTGDGFSVVVDWNLGNTPGNLNATIIQ